MMLLQSFPRAILHLDCDAFFASVEQALHPEYRNKPVVTGKERGIAAAMSYEAKKAGVTRGMRLSEIRRVCPDCIILPNDYESYSLFSKRVFGIMRRFTPDVEEYSIDEAFADITGLRRLHRTSYEGIASIIKKAVEKELGLSVSVGLSLTKSLAKICSKHRKPSGLTCVKGYELSNFLKEKTIDQVCGFGKASTELLKKHGVYTVSDYIEKPYSFAGKLLGKIGRELWHELRGQKVYEVKKEAPKAQRSLSKFKSFTPPSDNYGFVRSQLMRNSESAFIKLRRHRLCAQAVGVALRNDAFKTSAVEAVLSRPAFSAQQIGEVLDMLFKAIYLAGHRYRQTGIYLTRLVYQEGSHADLFEDRLKVKELRRVADCVDTVNGKYGKHSIHLGSSHEVSLFKDSLKRRGDVSPRKNNLLKGETFRRRINIPVWGISV